MPGIESKDQNQALVTLIRQGFRILKPKKMHAEIFESLLELQPLSKT